MPIYHFNCDCGAETEELVPLGTQEIPCPACGETARKVYLTPGVAIVIPERFQYNADDFGVSACSPEARGARTGKIW